ncbi:MAG: hypothetical protein AAFQ29_07580 [Pseudomonadota bacterium]
MNVRPEFQSASAIKKANASRLRSRSPKAGPKPYSIRFTEQERALLNKMCGSRAWSSYIRERLFVDQIPEYRKSPVKKPRIAPEDQKLFAQLLAALGQSRLSQNLNQIAKAANMGALPVSPELESELHRACADIQYMRSELVCALGLKSGVKP